LTNFRYTKRQYPTECIQCKYCKSNNNSMYCISYSHRV